MNITGEKKQVDKSSKEVFDFISIPSNHEKLMPSDLSKFESTDSGYSFQLNGMPNVALKLKETTPNSQIIFTSAKESLDFDLIVNLSEISDKSTEVQLVFEGKFNPFIKMMVEKPLTSFITALSNNLNKM